ncbi:MAG: mannose-1-phosphate guanylyltransferase [Bacteroidales bacterium]|nr:mannose-1-phosphate guanylyltransferase [Bacteroidales bacterium]
MEKIFVVIMAGGAGSRFWPRSKSSMPKQFLDIAGTGRTLFQMTFDRFRGICPPEHCFVVTSNDYRELVAAQLPELHSSQILLEPVRRNTAPCIAYACQRIRRIAPDASIIVAPSDHLIMQEQLFCRHINAGLAFIDANPSAIVTLGVKPRYAEPEYGYIQFQEKVRFGGTDNLYKVKTFVEKPSPEMADVFVDSGEFLWNAGIYIWKLPTILTAFERWLGDVDALFRSGAQYYGTDREQAFINKIYPDCRSISVDFGIMEYADSVYVLSADIGWSDLETWSALYSAVRKDADANATNGDSIALYDTRNCLVDVPDGKIAILEGLDGYIVVDTPDTLLVCRREHEQQLQQFVDDVRSKKGIQFV